MPENPAIDDPLLFLPEVEKLVRVGAVAIWRREKRGIFPPRTKVGCRSAWFKSQIDAYLESLRTGVSRIGPAPKRANEARRKAAARRRAERETRAA